jgi:hypothetical protein
MKIAIISDILGNLPALQAVLSEIGAAGVDATTNCGGPTGRWLCAPGEWLS